MGVLICVAVVEKRNSQLVAVIEKHLLFGTDPYSGNFT